MTITDEGENKRKHLEMIQAVINRMASNSFLFKGWSITIIAAISAFAAKDANSALMVIPVVSTLLFWAVDAYYLMLERAFIEVYNTVRHLDAKDVDFAMTPANKDKTFGVWLKVLVRPVLVLHYGVVITMLVILLAALSHTSIHIRIIHGA